MTQQPNWALHVLIDNLTETVAKLKEDVKVLKKDNAAQKLDYEFLLSRVKALERKEKSHDAS